MVLGSMSTKNIQSLTGFHTHRYSQYDTNHKSKLFRAPQKYPLYFTHTIIRIKSRISFLKMTHKRKHIGQHYSHFTL